MRLCESLYGSDAACTYDSTGTHLAAAILALIVNLVLVFILHRSLWVAWSQEPPDGQHGAMQAASRTG
jgi:hypothetical protein